LHFPFPSLVILSHLQTVFLAISKASEFRAKGLPKSVVKQPDILPIAGTVQSFSLSHAL
jgi:hypothetical protein